MKAKPKQFEMDLGREPFALVAERGQDHERQQADAVQRESERAQAARTQWWFDQMRAAVDHTTGRCS